MHNAVILPVRATRCHYRPRAWVWVRLAWPGSTAQSKPRRRQARQAIALRRLGNTKKVSPGFEKYCTYPTGASLSDNLFSFVLDKHIVCDVCGLRSPLFESNNVLHITPTDTFTMQDLMIQGMQEKLQKYCSRCNKNTRNLWIG